VNQQTTEAAFETRVTEILCEQSGWTPGDKAEWEKDNALFPARLFAFLQATQPKLWQDMHDLHGDNLKLSADYRYVVQQLPHGNGPINALAHALEGEGLKDFKVTDYRSHAVRRGLIPIINSMSVVGLVAIPGMMTGQILGGVPPAEAARYQIMIMFLIAAATAIGVGGSVGLALRACFDSEHRLRPERITERPS